MRPIHSPPRRPRRASPPGLIGTSLDPPPPTSASEATSPATRWSPKLLPTSPAPLHRPPPPPHQDPEQLATLVRIYQREFASGLPPQFAWPRLQEEQEHEDEDEEEGCGAHRHRHRRHRRPRAQRPQTPDAGGDFAAVRAAAQDNARRMQGGQPWGDSNDAALAPPPPAAARHLKCFHAPLAAAPTQEQGRRERDAPVAAEPSLWAASPRADALLPGPCRALELERAAARRREEEAVWAAHRARREEQLRWRQQQEEEQQQQGPTPAGFWINLAPPPPPPTEAAAPPEVEEEEETAEAPAPSAGSGLERSVRWDDEQGAQEEVTSPREEEEGENQVFATARGSLDTSGGSGLGVSLHGSMAGAVEIRKAPRPPSQQQQPPAMPPAAAVPPAAPYTPFDASAGIGSSSSSSTGGGLAVSLHGPTVVGAVEMHMPALPDMQHAPYSHISTSPSLSAASASSSASGSPGPGMIGAEEEEGSDADAPQKKPPLLQLAPSEPVGTVETVAAAEQEEAVFRPRPLPATPPQQPSQPPAAFWVGGGPSPTVNDSSSSSHNHNTNNNVITSPPPRSVLARRAATAAARHERQAAQRRVKQQGASAAVSSSPPTSFLLARSPTTAAARTGQGQKNPQHQPQQPRWQQGPLPPAGASSPAPRSSVGSARSSDGGDGGSSSSSLCLAAKGRGRWRVRIGADGSLEVMDVGGEPTAEDGCGGGSASGAGAVRTATTAAAATTTTTTTRRFDKGSLMRGVGRRGAPGNSGTSEGKGSSSSSCLSPPATTTAAHASSPSAAGGVEPFPPAASPAGGPASLFGATGRSAFSTSASPSPPSAPTVGRKQQQKQQPTSSSSLWQTAACAGGGHNATAGNPHTVLPEAVLAGAATRQDADPLELRLLEGIITGMADGIALTTTDGGTPPKRAPPPPLAPPATEGSGGGSPSDGSGKGARRLMSRSLRDRRARRAALDARLATIDASIQGILKDLRALSSPRTRALAAEFGGGLGGGLGVGGLSLLR